MSLERLAISLAEIAVRHLDPDAVILFGSVAQGRANGDSDVDLLVVAPFRGPVARRGIEVVEAARDYPVALDALFLTPDEYAVRAAKGASFVQTVDRHGKRLYVRPGLEAVYGREGTTGPGDLGSEAAGVAAGEKAAGVGDG